MISREEEKVYLKKHKGFVREAIKVRNGMSAIRARICVYAYGIETCLCALLLCIPSMYVLISNTPVPASSPHPHHLHTQTKRTGRTWCRCFATATRNSSAWSGRAPAVIKAFSLSLSVCMLTYGLAPFVPCFHCGLSRVCVCVYACRLPSFFFPL